MKFKRALNEIARASDTKTGQKAIKTQEASFQKDRLLASLDLEIEKNRQGIYAMISVRRSSDESLKNFSAGPGSLKVVLSKLVSYLKTKDYTIDKESFNNCYKEIIAKSDKMTSRNKILAHDKTKPTIRNPNPKWDAEFVLKIVGGTGQTVGIYDIGNKLVKFQNTGEKEKTQGIF